MRLTTAFARVVTRVWPSGPEERSPSSSPMSRARRACSNSFARATAQLWRSTSGSSARRSPRTAATRSIRRETHFSTCSREHATRRRLPPRRSGPSRPTRGRREQSYAFASECTRASPPSPTRGASTASACTEPHGSWRRVPAGRSCSRKPRHRSSRTTSRRASTSVISDSIGSRTSTDSSTSTSSTSTVCPGSFRLFAQAHRTSRSGPARESSLPEPLRLPRPPWRSWSASSSAARPAPCRRSMRTRSASSTSRAGASRLRYRWERLRPTSRWARAASG